MQKWRRGGGEMPYTPKQFGEAIDNSIRILRKLTDKQVNEILNGRGIVGKSKERDIIG